MLYGGAAGGGKSDALLGAALQYVDVPLYKALLLRRTYADLSLPGALMSRAHEWLTGSAHWGDERKTWTFPSGATLTFGYCEHERDVYRYQGADFQFIGFDELTQFSEAQFAYLFSRLRRPKVPDNATAEQIERLEQLAQVPLRMRAASNPGGVGHGWVLDRYPIVKGTPAEHEGRIFIPAKVADNPGLDVVAYTESLSRLSDELRRQLLDGDWGAFEGQAFPMFKDTVHVIDRFPLDFAMDRFESMDYGLNNPTAWLFWPVDYDGNIVCLDMHYRPGLPSETTAEILRRRKPAIEGGHGWGDNNTVWADPSVRNRIGTTSKAGTAATIATEFADHGIGVSLGNNDPKAGLARLRELLTPDVDRRFPDWHPRRGQLGSPRMFVHHTCTQLIDQMKTAPLQPADKPDGLEKIDPQWEQRNGHAVAAARYGAMSRPEPSQQPKQYPDDPRARALAEADERDEGGDGWATYVNA